MSGSENVNGQSVQRQFLIGDRDAIFTRAKETDKQQSTKLEELDALISEKIKRDESPEILRGKNRMFFRAAYGEFMCSLLFYTPIFGSVVYGNLRRWKSEKITRVAAFVGGFQAIAISFAFSSISGAHFNPSISFALWLTGKLSNRKCAVYIFVQLLASVIGMGIITLIMASNIEADDDDEPINRLFLGTAVFPPQNPNLGKVFATEFFLTFFLNYVAFTVVYEDAEKQKKENLSIKTITESQGLTLYTSTPQSKSGFAPFAIGLTIFSLSLIGGESGGAFNPGRLFGPAIFSGSWKYVWLYWIAEILGGVTAGLITTNIYRFGGMPTSADDTVSATQAFENVIHQVEKEEQISRGSEKKRASDMGYQDIYMDRVKGYPVTSLKHSMENEL